MNTKFELDEDFEWFLEQFGYPTFSQGVTNKTIKKFQGKLPDRLLTYWQEYGFCGFMDGLFWIVNPDDYEDVLEAWLGDTEIVEQDAYYVIARSAFGELYLWGANNGFKYIIDTNNGWVIEKKGDKKNIAKGNIDDAIQLFFYLKRPESIDIEDSEDKPLFNRCKVMHKPLAYDEMYAFEPTLFLGGEPKLESTTKVNIFAHLSMLASFDQKELLDKDGLIQKAFS
ncbi:GAD-like domain-containing protein [Pseudoalteromonas marina]|uniref:GAD-like domain-containing protein n=1 Tax=Pseudoalteromonas marina TaxID=267375 RepID=A0ABT9FIW9_9GAMM|nr:GAD-like domain-containing protein [Pseudoalteromonas marina]MDP2566745.1 GAD-like domain-containing protein [Pseudoalteromonas marina]